MQAVKRNDSLAWGAYESNGEIIIFAAGFSHLLYHKLNDVSTFDIQELITAILFGSSIKVQTFYHELSFHLEAPKASNMRVFSDLSSSSYELHVLTKCQVMIFSCFSIP